MHRVRSALLDITGTDADDTLLGGDADDTLDGAGGNDSVDGGAGDDLLIGSAGDDTLVGGDGDDEADYSAAATAVVVLLGGEDGVQEVGSAVDGLGGVDVLVGVERVRGSAHADRIIGSSGPDYEVIEGLAGADTLAADAVSYAGSPGAVAVDLAAQTAADGFGSTDLLLGAFDVFGSAFGDTVSGTSQANRLDGRGGDDALAGFGGDDTLVGGSGTDTLDGGSGSDVYRVGEAGDPDVIVGEAESKTAVDVVVAAIDWSLGANLENLVLVGAARRGFGNELDNRIDGGAGDDTLDGGEAFDTLAGGAGDDVYVVDIGGDVVLEDAGGGVDTVRATLPWTLGAHLENLVLLGAYAGIGNTLDNRMQLSDTGGALDGASGNDTLLGGAGRDTLTGGTGSDRLAGGGGADTYVVDAGDTVVEAPTAVGGDDQVISRTTWVLGANLEQLRLLGSQSIDGTGNGLANALVGNMAANRMSGGGGADSLTGDAGNDTLDGGAGADNLLGGTGSDTYVYTAGDRIIEDGGAAGGIDTVLSAETVALPSGLEHLSLTGVAGAAAIGNERANRITGNAAANRLDGGAGDDTLAGGGGRDTLSGAEGNDRYLVDAGDVVVEARAGDGTLDMVESAVSWTLGANLERLVLTGPGAVQGIGNGLANAIFGNAAANRLAGGDGNDTLTGALGNDALSGDAGDDSLDGGAGVDTLSGGSGADVYRTDVAGDRVIEPGPTPGAIDTVIALTSRTLETNVERLTLAGTASIHATGNGLANLLGGNGAANRLEGLGGNDTLSAGAGDDTLSGGAGHDSLIGAAGRDLFRFAGRLDAATNVDRIAGFVAADDRIDLDDAMFVGIGKTGVLAAAAFHRGSSALLPGNRIVYDAGTGRLLFDADGSGEGAAVLFAVLGPGTELSAADFFVV